MAWPHSYWTTGTITNQVLVVISETLHSLDRLMLQQIRMHYMRFLSGMNPMTNSRNCTVQTALHAFVVQT